MKKKVLSLVTGIMLVSAIALSTGCDTGTTYVPVERATYVPVERVVVQSGVSTHRDSIAVKTSYLDHYFGIAVTAGYTQGAFKTDLLKLQPPSGAISSGNLVVEDAAAVLRTLPAVKIAVIGANLRELVTVYDANAGKTAAVLEKAGVSGVSAAYATHLAVALDIGLIDAEGAKAAAGDPVAGTDFIVSLLTAVADFNGVSRNFLGYSDEADIYTKFINAWEVFNYNPFNDTELYAIGQKAVDDDVTTGFNLKYSQYDARFLPDLKLIYGHSNIKHAQQLLAFLKSEKIVAKVAFEPKVSIYEWPANSGILNSGNEFDLVLEFSSLTDLQKIDGFVKAYADNPGGTLLGSWTTPMYYASFDVGEGYTEVIDNVITHQIDANRKFTLHPLSLVADKAATKAGFEAAISTLGYSETVEQVSVWANDQFFVYMGGVL
jgi:hypothetical protein